MTIPEAFQIAVQRHQAGQFAEAETIYRQILAAQPNHAGALHLLGAVASQVGRHEHAVEWISRAIGVNPNDPFAHYSLGEAYRMIGRLDDAAAGYRRAIQLKSDYPEAHNSLGVALAGLGQVAECMAAFRRALELKPEYVDAHNNLGAVQAEQGFYSEAIASYRRALQFNPDFPVTSLNLGNALRGLGQLDEAVAAYRRALELKPDQAEFHVNLGNALREQGQFDEAVAVSRRAVQLKPDLPEAQNNLGLALKDQGQLDEAITAYRRALELRSDYPEAYNNLGLALKDRGELDEAIAAHRRALELKPEQPWVHSNLIYALHFHTDDDAGSIAAERERWTRRFSEPLKPFVLPHPNDRSPERPLRIGYVSADFREHVVGRDMLPLFRRHDPLNFEIVCYSGVVSPDKLTEQFRAHAVQWRSTVGVSDEALAGMIRRDGVDILVDLTQHLAGNRLPMFARQPAPVQVSFAGYPETTGLEAIEYRISDRYLQAGSADEGTGGKEQVRLIDSFWCYDPCGVDVEVNRLPASERGSVTFGCLNNFCKMNEPALKLWGRVLGNLKQSRLILLTGWGGHRRRTLEILEKEGVEAGRIKFEEPRPRREYLELYHGLDIVLDTFPYNGHTTSLDALWMGVPVVSLAGKTPVSRAGLSLLSNLGLPEFAARSETEYVRIAEGLSRDLPRLHELRSTLRDRMKSSALMDAPRFARQVEAAYRSIWKRWCGDPPPLADQSD